MSGTIISVGGLMFMVPLVLMIFIAAFGEIPGFVLSFGGWSMALGVITAGIGAVMARGEG